eukprot:TRINITY_DN29209_c0_g1_i2.p1 TRINITY_DN29209_c0_g1~~TRINITY_DN29209_c0_g1_i2.p1  ORF type:complete len:154 (+),score=40.39 TRINITY_DN29209_c0_g1_i2:203-664(+)
MSLSLPCGKEKTEDCDCKSEEEALSALREHVEGHISKSWILLALVCFCLCCGRPSCRHIYWLRASMRPAGPSSSASMQSAAMPSPEAASPPPDATAPAPSPAAHEQTKALAEKLSALKQTLKAEGLSDEEIDSKEEVKALVAQLQAAEAAEGM